MSKFQTPQAIVAELGIADRRLKPKERQAFLHACSVIINGEATKDQPNVVTLTKQRKKRRGLIGV